MSTSNKPAKSTKKAMSTQILSLTKPQDAVLTYADGKTINLGSFPAELLAMFADFEAVGLKLRNALNTAGITKYNAANQQASGITDQKILEAALFHQNWGDWQTNISIIAVESAKLAAISSKFIIDRAALRDTFAKDKFVYRDPGDLSKLFSIK